MSFTDIFVTEVGTDFRGRLAVCGGVVYYLTRCCGASVTGVGVDTDNPDGVACRACYRPVPVGLAWAWEVSDTAAWATWADAWLAAASRSDADRVGARAAAIERAARAA